jgi:hypothetical protein
MVGQYEVWDCPFCGQNTISIIHFPTSVSVKRSRTAEDLEKKLKENGNDLD